MPCWTPLVVTLAVLTVTPVAAQTEPSFAGKNVQLIVGFGTGGGFDLLGRTVARHLGRYLPGKPNVVVQNMPGAGSYNAANHIYNVAPKDGSVIGLITGEAALGPITGAAAARFDPTRITWLGTPRTDTNICLALDTPRLKVRTLKQLYETELVIGSAGVGIGAYTYPKALGGLLGMKFKIILGFPSSTEIVLAMERGEIDAYFASLDSLTTLRPDWIPNNKILMLFQGGATPNPTLKEVPFITDLARTPDERAAIEFLYAGLGLSRPFIAPPDLPADRAKMLQDAFMATMRDPEFLADAGRQKLDIDPKDGEQLAALIRKVYATPRSIVDRIAALSK
jgi:tripartite-type tricarboxylate transporter receptor subunit TctC